MSNSILLKTSAQPIAHADVKQLLDAIVADARNELAGVFASVKQGKTPAGARARAIAQAADQLPARTRDALLGAGAKLAGGAVTTPKRVTSLAALVGEPRPVPAAAAAPASKLTLRVLKIKCVNDTSELGKDEMLLGGQASVIPLSGDNTFGTPTDAGTTAPVALGKFKAGDSRNLDLTLASFNLRDSLPFPRVFNVSMLLVEKDLGNPDKLVTLLKTIQALVEDKVVDKVQEFLTGLDDEKKFTALIALAVTLVPAAIGLLIGAVGRLVGDEAFPVFAAAISLESATSLFDGGKKDTADQVAQFSAFGGTYQVTFDYALS
jgi:hypothetical protein